MKFGRSVKFIVENDELNAFNISNDINQLSELLDRINTKSNVVFLSGLLSNIKLSLESNQA
ncbi:hypothetical protein KKB44_00710 [Candidatus Micrarchaeota archaeon]|nr:hypothetical protein [Candidatus Micrarchaeota archaeon]